MPAFTQYDVTVAAESFSQAASIVSGFAFVILVWLVDNLQRRRRAGEPSDGRTERALVFLAVTFMGNLIAALLWSVISGEIKPDSTRPVVQTYFVVMIFTLAFPLSLEAIVFFIASAEADRVLRIFREIFYTSLTVSWAFQWIVTRAVLQALDQTRFVYAGNEAVFRVLLPLSVLMVLAGGALSARLETRRLGLDTDASFASFSTICLGGILISAVAFGAIMTQGPDATLAKWVIWAGNLTWAGLLAWAMVFLPRRRTVL